MVDASGGPADHDRSLNDTLAALIQQVLQAEADNNTRLRRQTWHQLITTIQDSGKLGRPQRGQWAQGTYDELRAEALSAMWMYISHNLDKYQSDRGPVMGWINWVLSNRFTDAVRRWMRLNKDKDSGKYRISIDQLENFEVSQPEDEGSFDISRLIKIVEANQTYQQTHIRECPEASFADIFIRRMKGQGFEDIARTYGLQKPNGQWKTSTVSNFFYRKLQKFSPDIRKEYEQS